METKEGSRTSGRIAAPMRLAALSAAGFRLSQCVVAFWSLEQVNDEVMQLHGMTIEGDCRSEAIQTWYCN